MKGQELNTRIEHMRRLLEASASDTYISIEKAHLEVLLNRYDLMNTICESLPDGVFVKDLKGRIIMTNNAGPQNIDKTVDEIIGKTANEYLSPDSANRIMKEDRDVIEGGQIMTFEATEVISGVERAYLTTKIPYRDAEGEIIGVVGLTRDVTEQRQVEVIRREHETRFRELLEAAPDAIVGIDREGGIVLVNKQVEVMFGYSRDELIGQPVEMLIPERHRHTHTGHRAEYADKPHTRPMRSALDLSARRKDGSEFPVEVSLSPLNTDQGLFITSIIRDITDHKHLEAQLRQHTINLEEQVLQSERLATIGRMAAQVAHEIRNPLSSIGLNIELLADEINTHAWEERAEADELIQITLSEIERLNNVITDYLQFARMPSKQEQDISLNDLADELSRFIRPEANQMNVRIECNLNSEMDTVRIDPVIFRQAVLNCLRNALEAMPEGGVLTIATGMPESRAELSISDSGSGIHPDDQTRVFDPFYSTKDRGTGLGLPYVRQIVMEYGGELVLKSTPGDGTTIIIRLPGPAIDDDNE